MDWIDRLQHDASKKRSTDIDRSRAEMTQTDRAAQIITTQLHPRLTSRASTLRERLGLSVVAWNSGNKIRAEQSVPDSAKTSLWSYSYFEVALWLATKEPPSVWIEGRRGLGNPLPPNWEGSSNDWHGEPWYIKARTYRDDILSDGDCDKLFEWLAQSIMRNTDGDPPALDVVKQQSRWRRWFT